AYGRLLAESRWTATVHIYHRVWQIYLAHIFTFAVYVAVISFLADVFDRPGAIETFRMSEFVANPQPAMVQALLLQFQPMFLEILPLYIVLLAVFPLVLMALARHPLLALAPSAMLYALTQLLGWRVAGYPAGQTWYFDPLAWQFLFIVGAALGYA